MVLEMRLDGSTVESMPHVFRKGRTCDSLVTEQHDERTMHTANPLSFAPVWSIRPQSAGNLLASVPLELPHENHVVDGRPYEAFQELVKWHAALQKALCFYSPRFAILGSEQGLVYPFEFLSWTVNDTGLAFPCRVAVHQVMRHDVSNAAKHLAHVFSETPITAHEVLRHVTVFANWVRPLCGRFWEYA